MSEQDFEKEVRELIPLVIRHASDFFKISSYNSLNEALHEIAPNDFFRKCYEGFKLAQDKLIKSILQVEDELKEAERTKKSYQKGKKISTLREDADFLKINHEITKLVFQKATFQEVANVIVWTLLFMDRAHIKAFCKEDGGSGYLSDKNLESVISAANSINVDDTKFALISDLTSVLHKGDLLLADRGKITIAEVKEDSPINNLISDMVEGADQQRDDVDVLMQELLERSPKHGPLQLKRYIQQISRMSEITKYIQTDKMYDDEAGMTRNAHEPLSKSINFSKLLEMALEDFTSNNRSHLFIPTDCCHFGIFKRVAGSNGMANHLDFQHLVYHATTKPWDECDYSIDSRSSQKDRPELIDYAQIKVYPLKEKVFIPTHKPLFLLLDERFVIDLLMGRLDIYIHFNKKRFLEILKERRVPCALLSRKEASVICSESTLQSFPSFEGKYLAVGRKEKIILGWGLLYGIIYEFESGYTTANQLKDTILRISHPRLYDFLSRVKRFFGFKKLIYSKK